VQRFGELLSVLERPTYSAGWKGESGCAWYMGLETVRKSCCGGRRVTEKHYVRCSMRGDRVPARVTCRQDVCRSYLRRKADI